MEEVQKAAKEIHLYSYQSSAMNVEQGIQWNGQSFAVSVEFEEWLCEHILKSKKKMRNRKHLLCTAAWKARALLPVRLHAANMLKHHIVIFWVQSSGYMVIYKQIYILYIIKIVGT